LPSPHTIASLYLHLQPPLAFDANSSFCEYIGIEVQVGDILD